VGWRLVAGGWWLVATIFAIRLGAMCCSLRRAVINLCWLNFDAFLIILFILENVLKNIQSSVIVFGIVPIVLFCCFVDVFFHLLFLQQSPC